MSKTRKCGRNSQFKINVDKGSLKEIPARLILSLLKPETYFQSYWLIMESQTEESRNNEEIWQ